jgi:translation initiation factor IF-3
MLIDSQGNHRGVIDIATAMRMAQDSDLDLVQISDSKDAPVCKILDYGKYLYKKQKKDKLNKKNQHIIHVKEIRLRLNTGKHDLLTKLNKAKKFLEEGNKIKFSIMFRGREITRKDAALKMLDNVAESFGGISQIDKKASLEGRKMFLILTPK